MTVFKNVSGKLASIEGKYFTITYQRTKGETQCSIKKDDKSKTHLDCNMFVDIAESNFKAFIRGLSVIEVGINTVWCGAWCGNRA